VPVPKRVLIVAYHFPPEPVSGALRMGYLAKYLPELGWEPHVLTRRTSFAAGQHPNVIRVGGSYRVAKAAEPAPRRSTGSERMREIARAIAFFPDRASWWIPAAISAGIAAHRRVRFDAVLSSAMPASAHVVGAAVSAACNVPWVADYRDLWHGNPHVFESPVRAVLLRKLELQTLRRAAEITTITESMARSLRELHRRNVTTIPNTMDAAEWENVPFAEPDCFRLLHVGSLYDGRRNPELLFSAISALRAQGEPAGTDARMDFFGPACGSLAEAARRFGIEGEVSYGGIVERSQAMRLERSAALLLVIQPNDPATSGEFGSKIFEYEGAGRPILAIGPPGSVLRAYIAERKLGWFASSHDEVRDALRAAYGAYAAGRLQRSQAAENPAVRMTEAFASVLTRNVSRRCAS